MHMLIRERYKEKERERLKEGGIEREIERR